MKFGLNTTIDRQQLLAKLSQALNGNELSVFVGAGISKGAGYFDWKELLKKEAKNIKLDIDKERDLTEVAQYICNVKNRGTIDNLINEAFPSNLRPNDNHDFWRNFQLIHFGQQITISLLKKHWI